MRTDGFMLFVVLAILAVSLAWGVTSHDADVAACEAKRCQTVGHRARMIRSECLCVEVPK